MKIVKSAYVILCLTLLAVIANSTILNVLISKTLQDVKSMPDSLTEASYLECENLYNNFKKQEKYISLTVNHEDLTDVESSFAEMLGAIKANDGESVLTIKSRLIDALEHLRRLSGINIDSIL